MAKSFLGDIIDSMTLNKTSTNLSDHLAGCICHKETEPLWRMLRSTSVVWWTKKCVQSYTTREVWKSFDEVMWHCCRPSFYLMLPAMLSGVQHWTQKVPKLWYFRYFSIYLRYFVIINVIKLVFIWLTQSSPDSLVNKQRLLRSAVVKNKKQSSRKTTTRSALNKKPPNLVFGH